MEPILEINEIICTQSQNPKWYLHLEAPLISYGNVNNYCQQINELTFLMGKNFSFYVFAITRTLKELRLGMLVNSYKFYLALTVVIQLRGRVETFRVKVK